MSTEHKVTSGDKKRALIVIILVVAILILGFLSTEVIVPSVRRELAYKALSDKSLQVGDVILFGEDEWNNTWRVLDVQGSKVLVINERCVEVMGFDGLYHPTDPHMGRIFMTYPYCDDPDPVPVGPELWDRSGIRRWLNSEYLQYAFSERDRQYIEGEVFLLSRDEAEDYLGSASDRTAKYLKTDAPWWLRSGVNIEGDRYADYVGSSGVVNDHGVCHQGSDIGVRPALWLDADNVTTG